MSYAEDWCLRNQIKKCAEDSLGALTRILDSQAVVMERQKTEIETLKAEIETIKAEVELKADRTEVEI